MLCIFSLGLGSTKAESTVYLLVNANTTLPTFEVSVSGANNDEISIITPYFKSELGGRIPRHKKAIRKCIFKNNGRTIISYSYQNASGTKDWSDTITLELEDGKTYYIELVSGKVKYKIKELTEKEYLKKTKKTNKKASFKLAFFISS